MRFVIYYRGRDFENDELATAQKYFVCVDSILDLKPGDIVVSRFAMWPFFKDQERDIIRMGAQLMNTTAEHCYVADLKNYVMDLKEMTPKTWTKLSEIPDEGPFVLKGGTNSRKFEWSTMMYAETKQAASDIYSKLSNDSLIGGQDIYIRQYVPLKRYLTGLAGLPITKEFRFFVMFGKILSGGFYWSSHVDDLEVVPEVSEVPKEFLQAAIDRIGNSISFYALDVAQTEAGDWMVVELNDGQQSGLSENDPEELYSKMRLAMIERYSPGQ